ncbi:MAG: translocation/assembly module TamB [Sphingobacteriales bacterium]|nr:MAG: translocation/assembly module TamB [Sphingobacteriales bacterium]
MLFLGGIILALRLPPVQTWAAQKATKYLSGELKTRVEVKSLYLKPFKSLVLEGLYIEDLQKDTLLLAPKLVIDINYFSPFTERKITLNNIELYNGKFYLKKLKDSSSNLSFIIKYFDSGKVDTTKKDPFDITFDKVTIKNFDFKYKNFLYNEPLIKHVNYEDVHLKHLNIALLGLDIKNYLFKAKINKLSFTEKSGFVLNELSANAVIDTNKIVLNQLKLITPKSALKDFFSMTFKSFNDFDDFENKVTMEGHFRDAKIAAQDVAYFSSALNKINLGIEVNGNVKGIVKNLKAKNLQVKVGKASYFNGDFLVKGLPDIKNTFLNLKFSQLATNKTDLDYIIYKATGNKKSIIPTLVNKFGNVNFKGQFTGFTNDFIAYGDFKTKMGRIKTDVNLKINKAGTPFYNGTVQVYNFELGQLVNENQLGQTSLKLAIKGSGFNFNKLNQNINTTIAYLDFNNYRYHNIALKGLFANQLFKGKIAVNDVNLKLDFNGSANLKPKFPEFDFYAKIGQANLRKLKFINDTITVDAEFNTKFTGNSLANIAGDLALNSIKVQTAKSAYKIDSVNLKAQGFGINRLLALKSDFGDANLKGQYDLNTLPSAFKVVLKKYIPSLKTNITPPKKQNFQFDFDLKNMDVLTSIFLPTLSIPERGSFNGKFNSDSGLVSLTGFVKTIKFNKMVYHNIIIDQNTLPKSLEVIIAIDKINITDSIITQNVILQNSLRNDSLTFNVKLSDKSADNQLDLYGLVEFGTDTTAKLSILPSDIIVDNQVWKVQDKARIKFENNKTIIEGFTLGNNKQLVAVNGSISDNADDLLNVAIENLSLKTLSKLTKGSGVNLLGTLNGNVHLSSLLTNPNIESDITIESLQYNKTFIGNMQLSTGFNNQTNLIDVNATIDNKGLKTLDIKGAIDIKSETNNLDLNVFLDKTELIIFDPFVNDIVSNLSGQISSNLKITGPFKAPQINGTAALENASLTVNYLNTAYTINDKVLIQNSMILINELVIKDAQQNKALVNGTVDLANPANPDIEVNVSATKFMALNTTAKNNQPYYGLAFATGDFNFNGPTDALKIVINAKTDKGTNFTIPLNNAATVGANDFIFYVSKDTLRNNQVGDNFFKGLSMDFQLRVDDAAQVKILTPVGNLMGTGNADLRLLITTLGDFEMYGDYVINNGKFDFTANNVINKTFDIKKGSDIRWTGDPSNANININAAYLTRTPISPLYLAAGQTQTDDRRNETVLAQANMILTNSLFSPDIKFELEFPNNTDIKTRLGGYLNNKDNENQQVINLVVRNSFSGSANGGLGFQNSDLLGSGLELAFSKFNNILSQSLQIKNLDFNVRSVSELGGTYSLWDNRVTLRGNFSNNRYSAQSSIVNNNLFNTAITDVTRDLEINYNIKKDASFAIKGFQRPANRDFFNLNRDIYINGIGLVYTQEYDTFAEFIHNTFFGKKKTQTKPEIKKPKS